MDLVITDPILSDYKQYHELVTESHIQKEFHNFRRQRLEDTKKEIEYWVANQGNILPDFLRILKITEDSDVGFWDDSNSQIIGFIANLKSGSIEHMNSGFENLINFGIAEKFQGKGIMTSALNMTMTRLKELEFNISTAFVKPNNIGSARVLEKCGFDLVREMPLGNSYAKALHIDLENYKNAFGLQ
jgi:RimJ/RimL family protein N-acetyltransferase